MQMYGGEADMSMCSVAAITRTDFSMEKEGYTHQSALPWMAVLNDDVSEWAR
jgi:histone acetyltransferase HTATIP